MNTQPQTIGRATAAQSNPHEDSEKINRLRSVRITGTSTPQAHSRSSATAASQTTSRKQDHDRQRNNTQSQQHGLDLISSEARSSTREASSETATTHTPGTAQRTTTTTHITESLTPTTHTPLTRPAPAHKKPRPPAH